MPSVYGLLTDLGVLTDKKLSQHPICNGMLIHLMFSNTKGLRTCIGSWASFWRRPRSNLTPFGCIMAV
jgi:hypothetical protein